MEQKYSHSQHFYWHTTWNISSFHCRPDPVVGTGYPSSFPANPLNSPFIFSTCRKSPLFFTAAVMSYHCQSSHYISAFLSNFSLNLSASLGNLHFSLASLLNDPFDHFHFLFPDALLQLPDLPKCSSFTFHTFIKHLPLFCLTFLLLYFPHSSYQLFCPITDHQASPSSLVTLKAVPFDSTDLCLMITSWWIFIFHLLEWHWWAVFEYA